MQSNRSLAAKTRTRARSAFGNRVCQALVNSTQVLVSIVVLDLLVATPGPYLAGQKQKGRGLLVTAA